MTLFSTQRHALLKDAIERADKHGVDFAPLISRELGGRTFRPTEASALTPNSVGSLRSIADLQSVRDAWRSFKPDRFTVDPDFFVLTAECDPQVLRPHVIVLAEQGTPTALLAGRIERLKLGVKLGYRSVYAPEVSSLTVIAGGILGDVDEVSLRSLFDGALGAVTAGEADVAIFRHVPLDSTFHRLAAGHPGFSSRQLADSCEARWELDLAPSFDELLDSFSASRRKTVKRSIRRLETEYGERLVMRVYTDPAELDEYMHVMESIAAKTYQRALGVAFGDTPAHRVRTRFCMERGWYRGYVLFLDGRPIAFEHGRLYNGRFFSSRPGYDPAFAKLSVGTHLFLRTLADLCANTNADVFDYGFGDAEYKRSYGSRCRHEGTMVIYAPTFRAHRIKLVRSTMLAATTAGRRAVGDERLQNVKRRWRRRLQRSR